MNLSCAGWEKEALVVRYKFVMNGERRDVFRVISISIELKKKILG